MDWILNRVSLLSGQYRGHLVGAGEPPALRMVLDGETIGNLTPSPIEGRDGEWQVEGDLGPGLLSEGTRTVVIVGPNEDVLDSVTVVAGLNAPEDLRAELDALRAEVGLLKSAFRRHVFQTE